MTKKAANSRQGKVLLLVGTRKGAFFFWGDRQRSKWTLEGPFFKGWEVYHLVMDPRDGTIYAAINSPVWGPHVQRSHDFGVTWEKATDGLEFERDANQIMKRVWTVQPGARSQPGVLYAGVEPAGLFKSENSGAHWYEVRSINRHHTRDHWTPGAGGLALHTIQVDGTNPSHVFVGISAAGIFRTQDGETTWTAVNIGVRADFLANKTPDVGQCVHKFAIHPTRPRILYQQNHCGVYKTENSGELWKDIGKDLPSRFGFPLALSSKDANTIFVIPEESDEFRVTIDGKVAVWRSEDGGKTWHRLSRGLPQKDAWANVLREALAVDTMDPCGVYFGTTTGQLYYSRNSGNNWGTVAEYLPTIYSVECGIFSD